MESSLCVLECPEILSRLFLPFVSSYVAAGFPTSADDGIDGLLDLNQLMISHPAATFFVRAQGDSMRDAGIRSGDILVVDRSITATNGKIVIAVVNGEFTVKRFFSTSKGVELVPENSHFPVLKITSEKMDFQVWGVVTYVIHKT